MKIPGVIALIAWRATKGVITFIKEKINLQLLFFTLPLSLRPFRCELNLQALDRSLILSLVHIPTAQRSLALSPEPY